MATASRESTGMEKSRFGGCPPIRARSAGAGSADRLGARTETGHPTAASCSAVESAPPPISRLDPRSSRCPVLSRKRETGGTPTPSGGRVRALQAILRSWIPPNRPPNAQNRRESGFPGSVGARGPDRPHPSRLGTRLRAQPHGLAGHDQVPGWRVRRGPRRPDRRPRRGGAQPRLPATGFGGRSTSSQPTPWGHASRVPGRG